MSLILKTLKAAIERGKLYNPPNTIDDVNFRY